MSDHTTPGSSRSVRAGRELALTIGAIAGLVCVLAAAASMLFGIKPLVFRSGSMSPEIATGSLALARNVPATDLAVGDVVSVVNGQGTRITHRVYELDQQAGNSVTVTLKGDANAKPDAEPYFITEADRIFLSVGGLGYAVAWLSSPLAIFLGGALVGGLVIIAFRPSSRSKDSDDGPSGGIGSVDTETTATTEFPMVSSSNGTAGHHSVFSLRKLAILGVSAFALIGVTQVSGTAAAFTDNATANSGSFAAASNFGRTPLVAPVSCSNPGLAGFRKADISWTSLGAPYTYRVIIRRTSNGSIDRTIDTAGTSVTGIRISNTAVGYQAEVYTVNGSNISTGWRGHKLWVATTLDTYCDGAKENVPSGAESSLLSGESAPLARGAAPTTTTAAETTTSSAPTTTGASTTAPTTTNSTSTTGPTTTTENSTSTTTQSTTPTTTTDATATTTTTATEAPVALGAAETSLTGYSATLMQNGASVAMVVTDSSGTEVSSTPVSVTATVMWQSDADELWIVDGANVYRVHAATGLSQKNPTGEAPAEIAAWIDGQK